MDEEKLVEVYTAGNKTDAVLAKGLLIANGIDAVLAGEIAGEDLYPGIHLGPLCILVKPKDADDARTLIEESKAGNV